MEVLLIVCGVAAWITRLPYLLRQSAIGRTLARIPDSPSPWFTVPFGALVVASGLGLMPGSSAVRLYAGLSQILLGVSVGLGFLFRTRIGTAGILDSFGRFASWDNIESYSWSLGGSVLELQLRRALIFRRRSIFIPARFRDDVAAYLSHRLWGAEEKQAPGPSSPAASDARQMPLAHSFDQGSYNS